MDEVYYTIVVGFGCRGQNKKLFRRKSRRTNKPILDSNCKEKVEEVVRIKQKQEEDKAQVTLHSFQLV